MLSGDTIRIILEIKDQYSRSLKDFVRQFSDALASIKALFSRTDRDTDENTRRTRSNIQRLESALKSLQKTMQGVGGSSQFMGKSLSLLLLALGPVVSAIAQLGGALVSLAASLGAAAVALGGGLIAGLAAAVPVVTVLIGAFQRLGKVMEAVKAEQKATASSADDLRARQDALRSSTQALTRAQEGLQDAHKNIADSRREAKRQLEDLALAERRVRLEVQASTLALEDSNIAYERAASGTSLRGLRNARLGRAQAQLGVAEARQGRSRTLEDAGRARAGGIDGDQSVIQATRALRDANWQLADAQRAVYRATNEQTGAASELKKALEGLTPAEKALFEQTVELRKEWEAFNKEGSEPFTRVMTEGVKGLRDLLADPALRAGLQDLTKSLAGSARMFGAQVFDKQGMETLRQSIKVATEGAPILASAMANLVKTMGNLARAGGPTLLNLTRGFRDWSASMNRATSDTEKVARVFREGEKHLGAWVDLLGSVWNLLVEVGKASSGAGLGLVAGMTEQVQKLTEYMRANPEETKRFFESAAEAAKALASALLTLGQVLLNNFDSKWVERLSGTFSKVFVPALDSALKVVSMLTTALVKIIEVPFIGEIAKWAITAIILQKATAGVAGAFAGVLSPITSVVSFLAAESKPGSGTSRFSTMMTRLGPIFIAVGTAARVAFLGALSAIMAHPVVAAIVGIVAVLYILEKKFGVVSKTIDWVRDHTDDMTRSWERLSNFLSQNVVPIFDGMVNSIKSVSDALGNLKKTLGGDFSINAGNLGTIAKWIAGGPSTIVKEGLIGGIRNLFSAGGVVPGPRGGVGKDSVPAMLAPNEVVLTEYQQRQVGQDRIYDVLRGSGGRFGARSGFVTGGGLAPPSTPAQRRAQAAAAAAPNKEPYLPANDGSPTFMPGSFTPTARTAYSRLVNGLELFERDTYTNADYANDLAALHTAKRNYIGQKYGSQLTKLITAADRRFRGYQQHAAQLPSQALIGAGRQAGQAAGGVSSSVGSAAAASGGSSSYGGAGDYSGGTDSGMPAFETEKQVKISIDEFAMRMTGYNMGQLRKRAPYLGTWIKQWYAQDKPTKTVKVSEGGGGVGGAAGGGNVAAALAFAQENKGEPYSNAQRLSGSAWDCSSFAGKAALAAGAKISQPGTTATYVREITPGDGSIMFGFRPYKNAAQYNGGNDEHMGIRINGVWWESGGRGGSPVGPNKSKDSDWAIMGIPRGLAGASTGGGADAAAGGGAPAQNIALGQKMAAKRGWTGGEWTALRQLWTNESGWNHMADNPTSDAYGIPQAMSNLYPETATEAWRTSPSRQITWGMDYIKRRYGSPSRALAFWQSKAPINGKSVGHWYATGGEIPGEGQPVPIVAHGGEMVINRKQQERLGGADFLRSLLGFNGRGPQTAFAAGGEVRPAIDTEGSPRGFASAAFDAMAAIRDLRKYNPRNLDKRLSFLTRFMQTIEDKLAQMSDAAQSFASGLANYLDSIRGGFTKAGKPFQENAVKVAASSLSKYSDMLATARKSLDTVSKSIGAVDLTIRRLEAEQAALQKVARPSSAQKARLGEVNTQLTNARTARAGLIETRTGTRASISQLSSALLALPEQAAQDLVSQIATNARPTTNALGRTSRLASITGDSAAEVAAGYATADEQRRQSAEVASSGGASVDSAIAQAQQEVNAAIAAVKAAKTPAQKRAASARLTAARRRLSDIRAAAPGLRAAIAEESQNLAISARETELNSFRGSLSLDADAFGRTTSAQDARIAIADATSTSGTDFSTRATVLQERSGTLSARRAQILSRMVEASARGDQDSLKELTSALQDLDVNIAENSKAIKDNTKSALQRNIDLATGQLGLVDADLAIAGLSGPGFSPNINRQRDLLRQRGAALGNQRDQISQLLANETDPLQIIALQQQLKQNELAVLQNNQQLAELSGSMEQTWSSSAWTTFRTAIFDGLGGLLPQFQVPGEVQALATGGFIEKEGLFKLHAGEAVVPADMVGAMGGPITVQVSTPMQMADPVALSERIGWELRSKGRR